MREERERSRGPRPEGLECWRCSSEGISNTGTSSSTMSGLIDKCGFIVVIVRGNSGGQADWGGGWSEMFVNYVVCLVLLKKQKPRQLILSQKFLSEAVG